jgi:hypothetical protein
VKGNAVKDFYSIFLASARFSVFFSCGVSRRSLGSPSAFLSGSGGESGCALAASEVGAYHPIPAFVFLPQTRRWAARFQRATHRSAALSTQGSARSASWPWATLPGTFGAKSLPESEDGTFIITIRLRRTGANRDGHVALRRDARRQRQVCRSSDLLRVGEERGWAVFCSPGWALPFAPKVQCSQPRASERSSRRPGERMSLMIYLHPERRRRPAARFQRAKFCSAVLSTQGVARSASWPWATLPGTFGAKSLPESEDGTFIITIRLRRTGANHHGHVALTPRRSPTPGMAFVRPPAQKRG